MQLARVFDIHHCIGQYHLYGDGLSESVEGYARGILDRAEDAGAVRAQAFAWCLLGESLLLQARWDESDGCLERSCDLHDSLGSRSGALAWQRRAELAACRGAHDEVDAYLRQASGIATVSPMASHLWGRIHATAALAAVERGDPERAVLSVQAAAAAGARYGDCPTCSALLNPVAAEAFALLGDADNARDYADAAARVAASSPVRPGGPWPSRPQGAPRWPQATRGPRSDISLLLADVTSTAGQPFWAHEPLGSPRSQPLSPPGQGTLRERARRTVTSATEDRRREKPMAELITTGAWTVDADQGAGVRRGVGRVRGLGELDAGGGHAPARARQRRSPAVREHGPVGKHRCGAGLEVQPRVQRAHGAGAPTRRRVPPGRARRRRRRRTRSERSRALGLHHQLTPPPHNTTSNLQTREEQKMGLSINETAPDFEADTTEGKIRFHDWMGDSWAVLFSHPKDFTPVCTTELGYMAKLEPEFERRNVKVIGLSVDATEDHETWANDIEETQGGRPNYPIIGDADFNVSKLYGMLPASTSGDAKTRTPADNQTVRNVFVIGPDKKVKLILVYPMTTGRNFDEVLRVIDSLQLTAKHRVATPVNWKQGEDVIIAGSVSNDEAKQIFGDWKEPKPYIRIVPQPS